MNHDGGTALHIAAWAGHAEICEALVAAGVPVDVEDSSGLTASELAERNGHDAAAHAAAGH